MDLRESIDHQASFSLELTNRLSSTLPDSSNLAFSPISIHAALALVAAGAKGKTLEQILSVLRSDSDTELRSLSTQVADLVLADGSPSGGPKLRFANGVWVDGSLSLNAMFKEVLTSAYKAETKAVDFQRKSSEVRQEVNSWVHNLTGGLIHELLPPGSVDNRTRLVLGNALYFKGAWHEQFDSSQTEDADFYLLDGSTISAPFMSSKKKQYISDYAGFKTLKLPYKQGEDQRQFSMYIFLPEARAGLSALSEKLTSEPGFLNRHLPGQKVAIGKFKLPKFKISFGFEASALLKDLGLVLPFSSDADLTEMVDSAVGHSLSISSIFHKAFVEVNEEGTEAAAATAVVISMRGLPPPPMDFIADHPFLFLIREDFTGVVLFVGRVVNPRAAEL